MRHTGILLVLLSMINLFLGLSLFAAPVWLNPFVCLMFLVALPFFAAMVALFEK